MGAWQSDHKTPVRAGYDILVFDHDWIEHHRKEGRVDRQAQIVARNGMVGGRRDLVERDELGSRLLRAPAQEGVKGLFPRLGVHLGRLRQHAVHVEEQRVDVLRKPEHAT